MHVLLNLTMLQKSKTYFPQYFRYESMPCMINRIWGLKPTITTPPSYKDRETSKNSK